MKTSKKITRGNRKIWLMIVVGIFLLIIVFLLGVLYEKNSNQSKVSSAISNQANISTIPGLSTLSIAIPKGWKMSVKPFNEDTDLIGFPSSYFSRAECGLNCQGVRLQNEQDSFDLIFDIIMDDHGIRCSNSVKVTPLKNNWYRLEDDSNYTYVMRRIEFNTKVDNVLQEVSDRYRQNGWEISENKNYKVCINGTGEIFKIIPDGRTKEDFGGAVLLEYPTISKTISEMKLREVDAIISSIKEK